MKTRADYMAGRISHEDYYSQFVTPAILETVAKSIGRDRIKASTDPHFNDIPLHLWDRVSGWSTLPTVEKCPCCGQSRRVQRGGSENLKTFDALELIRAAGEGVSASTITCILKAAARQIKGGS